MDDDLQTLVAGAALLAGRLKDRALAAGKIETYSLASVIAYSDGTGSILVSHDRFGKPGKSLEVAIGEFEDWLSDAADRTLGCDASGRVIEPGWAP